MIKLSIITQEKIVYQDEVNQITIPTEMGVITVLPDHIPLVSLLTVGEMCIKKQDYTVPFAISGGILEVRRESEVIVLADRAEHAKEIDVSRAEEAYKRAKEFMESQEHDSDVDFARVQSILDKELNRIAIGSKYSQRFHR